MLTVLGCCPSYKEIIIGAGHIAVRKQTGSGAKI